MFYLPRNIQFDLSVTKSMRDVPQYLTALVYYIEDSHGVVTSSNCITEALSAVFNAI
jgi:hypothetical protein